MRRFYGLYKNFQQFAEISNLQSSGTNFQQPAEEFIHQRDLIFGIPWGHHMLIIDKCSSDPKKAMFYIQQAVEHSWSRAVLLNFLDTDLYERQGKAVTNFALTLPDPQSDLAQEMTKDPYNFDFLTIRAKYDERELKDALLDNVQSLLMELGSGFAFVGREYRLVVGKTEQFLDLLFYNYNLHCFVVVEVKVTDFDPRDMGQLSTYVAAVDGIMRSEIDQPTIGLLICKTKDNVLAQYAADVVNAPIGISEYQLSKLLKEEFKGTLPTIEEIEAGLSEE
jgi:predicted nuclease of restriction endonuclease-like (RecB) superfamily